MSTVVVLRQYLLHFLTGHFHDYEHGMCEPTLGCHPPLSSSLCLPLSSVSPRVHGLLDILSCWSSVSCPVCRLLHGVNAVSMRKSPELEAKASHILRHQLVGGKVHTYRLFGTVSRDRSPTCYLQDDLPCTYSSSLFKVSSGIKLGSRQWQLPHFLVTYVFLQAFAT